MALGRAVQPEHAGRDGRQEETSLEIGKSYMVRTLTFYYTGRLVAMTVTDLVLDDAACVFATGRLTEAFEKGKLDEVEPLPSTVIVMRQAIVDVIPWTQALPRKQV